MFVVFYIGNLEPNKNYYREVYKMIRTDLYYNKLRELRAILDEAGYSL